MILEFLVSSLSVPSQFLVSSLSVTYHFLVSYLSIILDFPVSVRLSPPPFPRTTVLVHTHSLQTRDIFRGLPDGHPFFWSALDLELTYALCTSKKLVIVGILHG